MPASTAFLCLFLESTAVEANEKHLNFPQAPLSAYVFPSSTSSVSWKSSVGAITVDRPIYKGAAKNSSERSLCDLVITHHTLREITTDIGPCAQALALTSFDLRLLLGCEGQIYIWVTLKKAWSVVVQRGAESKVMFLRARRELQFFEECWIF